MSLSFSLKDDILEIKKIKLPSRSYFFNDTENYMKLLNVGEGFFPNDRVYTTADLSNSSLIITSESASKVYSSNRDFAVNKIDFRLKNSNLEYIGDELILFKKSKFAQFFNLYFDEASTFFCCDILSGGRSYEKYDFSELKVKNRFLSGDTLEYFERFDISGSFLKRYIQNHSLSNSIFAKIYAKTKDNELFADAISQIGVKSFEYTHRRLFVVAVILADKISTAKEQIYALWKLYRKTLQKDEFDLGKR